jgi:hypothetical protein
VAGHKSVQFHFKLPAIVQSGRLGPGAVTRSQGLIS